MKSLIAIALSSILGTTSASTEIQVGAEKLDEYLPHLEDTSIAMMVNQSSLVGDKHLVDVLNDKGVNINSILAVEHGFRGTKGAGEKIDSSKDPQTGIEIISLYGKQRYLTAEQLNSVDVLLYDLQDVGVRFYTYSRSLHDLMQSCHEFNKTLIVLDRPNPNGDYIAGPILTPELKSGLSVDPLPLVHGLTMGELASMIQGEGWLDGDGGCELKVITINNYDHNMNYSLPVRPSPNLPNDLSIRLYPSLALFEGTSVSVGRGTDFPFQVLGYPDPRMGEFEFVTKPITGSWSKLNHEGETLYGERFESAERFNLSVFVRWQAMFQQADKTLISRPDFFDLLLGDKEVRIALQQGKPATEIEKSWQPGLKRYQQIRKKYLLYPDSDWMSQHFPASP